MELLKSNIYFCDTETGGLKPYNNGLCSLFITKYGSIYQHRFFFYPQNKVYDYGAFQINRLSFQELREKGLSRDKFVKEFDNICSLHLKQEGFITFCGWNSQFDLDFISQVYKDKNQKLKAPILNLDLLEVYKKHLLKKDGRKKDSEGVEDYKLTTVYQYIFRDIDLNETHTDIYDVKMVIRLFDFAIEKRWLVLSK